MKITKIHISDFYQFQNFELNLTYPKGHDKAGQPLDKVCFIGQSGTGKTTMLEMIREACVMSVQNRPYAKRTKFNFKKSTGAIFYFKNKNNDKPNQFDISINYGGAATMSADLEIPPFQNIFYFIAGLPFIDFNQSIEYSENALKEPMIEYAKKSNQIIRDLKFDKFQFKVIWNNFFNAVADYQKSEVNFRLELSKKAEYQHIDFRVEMEKWKAENINPLQDIADRCLNPLLNKFHLAVETEISDVDNLKIIQIKSLKDGKIIPFDKLSTGTKQIIFTAFPIYYLSKNETSVILMDEPENSLYPDIQKELIDFYTSFDQSKGEKTQFFFATHSPIIASSFEPWEIVELKFDGEGKIYRDIYYDGENHVDNYKIDPRYLRWDDILTKVFDMKVDGNGAFRLKKLTEYVVLKDKIAKLKADGALKNPTDEVKKIIDDFKHTNDLLNGNWAKLKHEED